MPLLFVDMLGVKARWLRGGRIAAEAAFQQFWGLIGYAVRGESSATIALGLVESDSVAIDCKSTGSALRIAEKMYHAAFIQTYENKEHRVWLRGVILERTTDDPLRMPSKFKKDMGIDLMLYSGDLLDAITIEKCGFKGMRVLISQSLITEGVKEEFVASDGEVSFIPFARLRHSSYPNRIESGFSDYLWMARVEEEEKRKLDLIMALRLRHASMDPEESLQAAATQVMFHEVTAMIHKRRARERRMRRKVKG